MNELRYEREDSQPPPAQRPKRRHITPEEEKRLPPWYEREIRAATLGPDIMAAIADVIERGALWLELTAAGRPAAEVDAAVKQLAVEQLAQRAGPGGASCRSGPQRQVRR